MGVLSGPGYCKKKHKINHPVQSLFEWVRGSKDDPYTDKNSAESQHGKNVS